MADRTKAQFRAMRDMVGMTLADLADACDVSEEVAGRWESPRWPGPPSNAYDLLERLVELQKTVVDSGVNQAVDAASQMGMHKMGSITLPYYRTQGEYDAYGRDAGPFGMANANSREIARELLKLGFDVQFHYPGQ